MGCPHIGYFMRLEGTFPPINYNDETADDNGRKSAQKSARIYAA
jgi:hypothetical protein